MQYIKKYVKLVLYLYYLILEKFFFKQSYSILNEEETIQKILDNKMSISRFGDGEFKWIFNVKQNSFQDYSESMAFDLNETFKNPSNNCLIGIPKAINSVKGYNIEAKYYWTKFKVQNRKKLTNILDKNYIYGDASFTRPYIDFSSKKKSGNKFNYIKKIWNKKDVLIVEGEGVNFGCGNNLLDNACKVQRIICPNKNAYDVIEEIYSSILKHYKKQIVLIALGPTASILCNKLSMQNIQAIDIGHLDVEYCWFINNCKSKVDINGKNVNESNNSKKIIINYDKEYKKSQIIDHIKLK